MSTGFLSVEESPKTEGWDPEGRGQGRILLRPGRCAEAQAREDHSVALGVVEWTRVASHEFEFHLGLYDGLSVCAPQHLRAEA